MNCETVSERLPELLAGTLDRETEAQTLAHLATCAACRVDLALWAHVAAAVNAEAAVLPEDTVQSVRERLFGERPASLIGSMKHIGRTLGLVRSACRLALSVAGK